MEDEDFGGIKSVPKAMPLSPAKMGLRTCGLFEGVGVKRGSEVEGCKFLVSDNLLILKDPKTSYPLTPTNFHLQDPLFASPLILKYSSEFHAWNKFIGKDFSYKTPKEEDIFSLGMVFMHTILHSPYELGEFKRKIIRLKSSKARLSLIKKTNKDLPYESLEDINSLLACLLNPSSKERPTLEIVKSLIKCMLPDRNKKPVSPRISSLQSSFDDLCDLSTDEKAPNKLHLD